MENHKSVHSLVLDAGPIIKNEPAVSSLLLQAEQLYTVPAIITEIKDAQTRSRVQTTLLPFLTIRTPNPKSIKVIADFARRTGDFAVLSKPDIEIVALTYELECERNQGDWRLRSTPGQKKLNGAPPAKAADNSPEQQTPVAATTALLEHTTLDGQIDSSESTAMRNEDRCAVHDLVAPPSEFIAYNAEVAEGAAENESVAGDSPPLVEAQSNNDVDVDQVEQLSASESDSDGWITPSNLKRQQAKDSGASAVDTPEPSTMQAAVLTSDFAMQNVILQMNLNLLSSSLQRVKHLRTYVLRCHACFQTTKDMNKQFCPRCGQAALTRVACSTNANGEFKLHLKKNMQWNTRGDRFSVPKPAHGSANGRVKGGGKGGWGHDLILAEDQKEYERARVVEKKQKERSLMDEDYLPSILTGDRSRGGGRIKVGGGRNVNSKKR